MIIFKMKNKSFYRMQYTWLISVFFAVSLYSQVEIKMIQIGSLQGYFANKGCEKEQARQTTYQQDGLRWPAYFQKQDCQAAKGFWIGCTNFTDASGKNYTYKLVSCGPRGQSGQNQFFTKTFNMTAKFLAPTVYVDNVLGTYIQNYVNDVDAAQLPDRIITNVVNTTIGIEVTRKIIAFSQQDNDNYFIYDYTFKNTGDVNGDGSKILNQTLNGLYFYWQYRYVAGMEGCEYLANASTWGINAIIGTRGDGSRSSTEPNEDLRCQYEYMGKYSGVTYDCIGSPYIQKAAVTGTTTEPYNGHLASTQHVGVVTIHADKSATDKTDDPNQPSTTSYEQSDASPENQNDDATDSYNDAKMAARYSWMTKGHVLPRHSDKIKDGNADGSVGGSGGVSVANGFGPYTLKPGESIHIVMAEGVAGLSRDLCYQYGAQWYAKTISDAQKDAYVLSGADSLFKTFRRAIACYKSGYNISQPPPPPDKFEVNSGGDRITLTWSKSAELDPTFAGYRIYRADSTWDNRKYKLIFECGKNTTNPAVVNTYDDKTPVRGYSYYYYIQSVGDGSNNNGVQLVSSRQYTQTYDPAYLRRMAGTLLKQIRVVPNPYNINAISYQYKGERDKIMFLDIPGQCTIRIYSERGDLLRTINHANGSGDEAWDMITSSKQFVASGIYIAYFETPDGKSDFRKFVVIR